MKATTIAALIALLCALVAGSSAVSAANAPSLGLTAFGSIVVDDAHSHVFVSGPNENEVLVFDLDDNLVKTIPNIPGAAAMVVQGSSLYVVAAKAGSIERIDLGTLADTGTVATGLATPQSLAFAGGKLWTGVNGNGQWTQLASVALDGTVTVFTPTYYNPDFATTPADPNALYLAQDGLSPGSLYRLDVAGGAPVVTASNINTNGSNIEQLAVSPDGTRVIPASGAPYNFPEFAASTLTADGIVYPAQPYPSAIAVSPGAGGRLATGLDNGYSSPDISVFKLGSPQAIFTATTTNSSGTANVVPHGLALSADGLRLFAVTADNVYANAFHLSVFNLNAASTATSVRVTPSPSGYGQGITATATVAPTDGGGTVSFSANNTPIPGCTGQQLTKTPNGLTATCTTTALPVGQDVVTASYSGDTQYLPSQGSATTTVNRGTTSMTASPAQLVKGKSGTMTATFGATLAAYGAPVSGRTIVFSSGGTELCAAATSASGSASCTVTVSNNASRSLVRNGYTAAFGGDNQYLASSASAIVSG